MKDFSQTGNTTDPSDRDGRIELRSVAAKGFYQPDGRVAYTTGGKTFLVMANEGDSRWDEQDEARGSGNLARLVVSNADSAPGALSAFGARSCQLDGAAPSQLINPRGPPAGRASARCAPARA